MLENENLDLNEFKTILEKAYINECKPVYTLLECLNNTNPTALDFLFTYYKDIHNIIFKK